VLPPPLLLALVLPPPLPLALLLSPFPRLLLLLPLLLLLLLHTKAGVRGGRTWSRVVPVVVFGWGLVIMKRGRGAHRRCPLPVLTLFAVALPVAAAVVVVLVVVVVAALSLAAVDGGGGDGGVGGDGGGDGGGGGGLLGRVVVVVVDRCDAVRSHLSELEISLNSDCNFEFIPVSSKNCLKSRIY
jgi:hypothetical protein